MKTLAAVVLLFTLASSSWAFATKTVWIIAPGVFDGDDNKRLAAEKKINQIQKNHGNSDLSISIVPGIPKGFAFSYYLKLKTAPPETWPDYLVYYQPARFFAWDFEELIFSDLFLNADSSMDISHVKKDLKDRDDLIPSFFTKILSEENAETFKKLFFLKERLAKLRLWFDSPDPDENILFMSIAPLQTLKNFVEKKSSRKTKFVLFLSPERIRYKRDIFGDATWANYLVQAFWSDISISRRQQKEFLYVYSLNSHYLPNRFTDLHQMAYLKKDSRYVLNSTGVERWTNFMGAAIADTQSPIK